MDSPLFADPGPIVTFGGAFDLGMSRFDTGVADRSYFARNDAHEFGGASTLDMQLEAWLQIRGHLRLGVDSAFGDGGDGRGTASLRGGGLLIEGGGALGYSGWSLWGGAVIGRGKLSLRTEDDAGNWFEYIGSYNRVELQGHAEVVVAPLVSLRGSVGLTRGWLIEDELVAGIRESSDMVPVMPSDTQMDLMSASVMFGIVFGW